MTSDRMARTRMLALGLWGEGRPSPTAAVASLTAMQAQEHAYARWSVAQRVEGAIGASAVDRAFDDGDFLRTHVLRPTWHYVAREDLRWLMALSGHRVLARSRRRSEELELDSATLARATDVITESVASSPRTRKDLAAILERKRISAAGQRMPYVLMYAELTSAICSGPMQGKQHTYAAFDERVGPEIRMVGDEALAELARRYFTSRGPATLIDFMWWSGLNTADARHGLELASDHLSSRSIDDRVYWFIETGATRTRRQVDLVQCYDEVIISYSQSRNILQSTAVTFPVPGHVDGFTHVVLVDGRIAGHWRVVRRGTESDVETRIDRPLDGVEEQALANALDRYRQFANS